MALSPLRGLPPREFAVIQPGKEVELFFGFSNGIANVKQGMVLWGLVQVNIRPVRWAIKADQAGTFDVEVSTQPYGGGSETIITGAEVPTLASPSAQSSSSTLDATTGAVLTPLTVWSDILRDQWVIARMAAITAGTPKFVGLTIWGVRV